MSPWPAVLIEKKEKVPKGTIFPNFHLYPRRREDAIRVENGDTTAERERSGSRGGGGGGSRLAFFERGRGRKKGGERTPAPIDDAIR